ncbi:hypothetical protein [Cryobacterium sp. Y50]|uniref:hypothetical protein n=1 Tax=Cryobacterium sp. Y50 TaxID=2048286 RepID=UPI0011B0F22E|nr:hypothetical protein [Cryobacterium sp. Y50]
MSISSGTSEPTGLPSAPSVKSTPSSAPVGQPQQVRMAFWLYLLAALAALIGGVVRAATAGADRSVIESQLATSGVAVSTSTIDAVITTVIIVAIIVAIIWMIAFVIFALFMKRGAGWARIVLTILAALSLTSVTGSFGLGALQAVAAVVATVLVWLRPAREYFQAVKASRVPR